MMKVVMKLDFADDKIKQKALQKVSGISGIESIAIDAKDRKLTITGDIDPVSMVAKLRKICRAEIMSVGPAKEPEKKKEEPKKEEPKKEEPKKEEPKKEEPKKEDPKTKEAAKEDSAQLLKAYQAYYQQPPVAVPAYFNRSVEEDPNGCVIC